MCFAGSAVFALRSRGVGVEFAACGMRVSASGTRDAAKTFVLYQSIERKQEIGGADGFSALSLA